MKITRVGHHTAFLNALRNAGRDAEATELETLFTTVSLHERDEGSALKDTKDDSTQKSDANIAPLKEPKIRVEVRAREAKTAREESRNAADALVMPFFTGGLVISW